MTDLVVKTATVGDSKRRAVFSPCEKYRYLLEVYWGPGPVVANYLLLNCSTADHNTNDATISRCEKRARMGGFGGLLVTNLFAFRATDPKVMKCELEPVGPENDRHIMLAAKGAGQVVCGWGKDGGHKGRSKQVVRALRDAKIQLHYIAMCGCGEPSHPLYIAYKETPKPWNP